MLPIPARRLIYAGIDLWSSRWTNISVYIILVIIIMYLSYVGFLRFMTIFLMSEERNGPVLLSNFNYQQSGCSFCLRHGNRSP